MDLKDKYGGENMLDANRVLPEDYFLSWNWLDFSSCFIAQSAFATTTIHPIHYYHHHRKK